MSDQLTCRNCDKVMTPENSTIAPELFLCDDCTLTPRDKQLAEEGREMCQLKACPFCGWKETAGEKANHLVIDGKDAVQCLRCEAAGPSDFTWTRALIAWNHRAQSD